MSLDVDGAILCHIARSGSRSSDAFQFPFGDLTVENDAKHIYSFTDRSDKDFSSKMLAFQYSMQDLGGNGGYERVAKNAVSANGNGSGVLLKEGLFVGGDFDTPRFLRTIDDTVVSLMKTTNAEAHSNRRKWQILVATYHRKNIKDLGILGGYPNPKSTERADGLDPTRTLSLFRDIFLLRRKNDSFFSTSACYGCLFGKPEYCLPCRHAIYETCLRNNDRTVLGTRREGIYVHMDVLIRIRPDLSVVRVLSLDGAGVRGIVELVVLERLEELIGLEWLARVAATTTADRDCNLIANYNRGGDDRYLNSELHLWEAAQGTSAAPMFFELMQHSGVDCQDGGLKDNNPVQISVNEPKKLWGEKAHYDLILSYHERRRCVAPIRGCTTSACPRTLPRLNVRFPGTQEPALDAFEQMDSMESTARAYNKFHGRASNTPISPVSGIKETGMLETLADRLRASLHYLQVKSISRLDEVYIIRGWIRCRIEPSDKGSHRFLKQTSGLKVKKTFYSAAGVRSLSGSPPMSLEVESTH
ncbi:hypothetical protein F5882DRAFT_381743 [Hyaloscypha sp. PMI_1271]|nr:hypothetical protein F5882DRAFT_381743 [Hyaloscypha sp. PMI_1271]